VEKIANSQATAFLSEPLGKPVNFTLWRLESLNMQNLFEVILIAFASSNPILISLAHWWIGEKDKCQTRGLLSGFTRKSYELHNSSKLTNCQTFVLILLTILKSVSL
jgi:hypothetical protein